MALNCVTIEPDQIELFFGDASDALARIYVRLPRAGLPTDAAIRGRVIGPHCEYSTTLPATISLTDKGKGETLLAEAVVPDPCYWTPELPFLYRVQIEIGGRGPSSTSNEPLPFEPLRVETLRFERTLGLRRLGVRARSLYFEGKRFVPRGAYLEQTTASDIESAHDTMTTLMLDAPSDEICELAERRGTLLIARLDTRAHSIEQIRAELSRLSRFAAVGMVILPGEIVVGIELRSVARNLVLVQSHTNSLAAASTPGVPQPWAHARLCELTDQTRLDEVVSDPSATLIWRRDKDVNVDNARRGCDRLQAELASIGDFAGYFV